MSDSIKTKYVKGGYAEIDGEIIVDQTPTTRTVIKRALTPKGVRAEIIRQKIGDDGNFTDIGEVNFKKVPANAGVRIEIPSEGLKELAIDLYRLFKTKQEYGVKFGEHEYVVADKDEVIKIDDKNAKKIIEKLVEQGYSDEFLKELDVSKEDISKKFADAKIQANRAKAIKIFKDNLNNCDEGFWQQYFQDNPWVIQLVFSSPIIYLNGETLLGGKNTSGRSGSGGVATDFLCADETSKSFSVVEIKTPCTPLAGISYRGKGTPNEIFAPNSQLTGALVQVQKQVKVAMEDFASYLKKDYKDINFLHPHSVVIAGKRSELISDNKLGSFNLFRHAIHATTVITYDELLRRLELVYLDD